MNTTLSELLLLLAFLLTMFNLCVALLLFWCEMWRPLPTI